MICGEVKKGLFMKTNIDDRTGQDVFDWWMNDRNLDKPVPGQIEWEDME